MFGLSLKEKLSNVILKSSCDFISDYKNDVINLMSNWDSMNEVDADSAMMKIRRDYLDNTANSVFEVFKESAPKIFFRMISCLQNSSMCGYEIDVENGIMAGGVYAICYFAFTNKFAKPKHCITLNHAQDYIIEHALQEIETRLL